MGKITRTHIPYASPEWYDFRMQGLGGSEVSTVMNLNPYQSKVRLFYEKIGDITSNFETNEFMAWGQINEDNIANIWQYYDGTDLGYISNWEQGNIIRKCSRVNAYSVNSDYDWLFGSYDRVINKKGGFRLDGPDPLVNKVMLNHRGILEIKTISDWAANKWEGGVPVYYIPQKQTYMMIEGADYAELVILKNGNKMEVYPMAYNENLAEGILIQTKDFWDKVLLGREVIAERNKAIKKGVGYIVEECDAELFNMEPENDGSEDYEAFMTERARETGVTTLATDKIEKYAAEMKYYTSLEKAVKSKKQYAKNEILKEFNEKAVDRFDLKDDNGYVNFILPKNQFKKRLYNRIKWSPSEEDLESQLEGLEILT